MCRHGVYLLETMCRHGVYLSGDMCRSSCINKGLPSRVQSWTRSQFSRFIALHSLPFIWSYCRGTGVQILLCTSILIFVVFYYIQTWLIMIILGHLHQNIGKLPNNRKIYFLCRFIVTLYILNVCHVGKTPIRTNVPSQAMVAHRGRWISGF